MTKREANLKVSKNPNKNWENNSIQFARLIAEAEAAGAFNSSMVMQDLSDSMDLTIPQVCEIIDRAQKEWDKIKAKTIWE